jgi:very-short-patch-repair endonuclease
MEGSPNPRSPGEMLLAERLAGEPDLAGLFEFNAAVDAAGGGRFIADLLWREGRLVIEVDGYGPHSSLQAFCRDRDRDFRLLLSGYRVVRIPHGELSASPEGALGKIRMAVRYVRGLAP